MDFQLFKDPLSLVFVLGIIGVAIFSWWLETQAINRYKNRDCHAIEKGIDCLENFQAGENQGCILEEKVGKETIGWIKKYLAGEAISRKVFKPKRDKEGRFILLSYPTVLSRSVPRSPVYYAPTLLTALGILGTFLGIFLGLQGVNLDALETTDSLLNASTKLLSGMKLAFGTSLAGMSTAIVSMYLLAKGGDERQTYRNRLRQRLGEITILETPERILSRLDTTSSRDAAEILKEVAKNLSGFSQLSAEGIGKAVKEAIASEESLLVRELKEIQRLQTLQLESLTPNLIAESASDRLTPCLDPIALELERIRELQETQGQTAELLVRQLRLELIEPLTHRFDRSAALTEEASEAVKALKNELGDITQSLAGAVETIQSFQQDTLVRLQQFAGHLQEILADFRTDTQGVMTGVAADIQQAMQTSIEGMIQQRRAFQDNADRVGTSFQNIYGIIEDTNQVVQQELERFREEYRDRLTEFLESQQQDLTIIIDRMGEVFREDLTRREELMKQIDRSLENIQKTVEVTSDLVIATDRLIAKNSSDNLASDRHASGNGNGSQG